MIVTSRWVFLSITSPEMSPSSLIAVAEPRLPANALHPDVDLEWFLQPLRELFGASTLAELMAEGAAWSQGRAIEEALGV